MILEIGVMIGLFIVTRLLPLQHHEPVGQSMTESQLEAFFRAHTVSGEPLARLKGARMIRPRVTNSSAGIRSSMSSWSAIADPNSSSQSIRGTNVSSGYDTTKVADLASGF